MPLRSPEEYKASLRDGVTALQQGKVLVVYPEGTISRDPQHWPMHPHTGVARLALSSGAPVVPMVHFRRLLDFPSDVVILLDVTVKGHSHPRASPFR